MPQGARISCSRGAIMVTLVVLALSTLGCSAPLPESSADAAERAVASSLLLQKRSPVLMRSMSLGANTARGFAASHRSMSMPSPSPGALSRVSSFGRSIPGHLSSFHHRLPPGFISQQFLPTSVMLAPGMIQTVSAWKHRKDGLPQQQQQQQQDPQQGVAGYGTPGMMGGY